MSFVLNHLKEKNCVISKKLLTHFKIKNIYNIWKKINFMAQNKSILLPPEIFKIKNLALKLVIF